MAPDDFPTRAKHARIRAGFIKPEWAARAIGCGRTTILRWEKDAESISTNYLHAAAKAYKVRPQWLAMQSDDDGFPWTDEADGPSVDDSPASSERRKTRRLPSPEEVKRGSGPLSSDETPGGYVRAVDMGAEGSMGDGRINDDFPEVIRAVDYTQQYIRGLVGFVPPPGRLVLFTGRGDSMMPTIQPGESLLVDTGITSYDRDGIYLVNLGNGQQIKRLVDHGSDAGVHVHSDNPAYPAIRWPNGAVIGGKVYLRNRTDRMD